MIAAFQIYDSITRIVLHIPDCCTYKYQDRYRGGIKMIKKKRHSDVHFCILQVTSCSGPITATCGFDKELYQIIDIGISMSFSPGTVFVGFVSPLLDLRECRFLFCDIGISMSFSPGTVFVGFVSPLLDLRECTQNAATARKNKILLSQ